VVVDIGKSGGKSARAVAAPGGGIICPTRIDKHNWIGLTIFDDWYNVAKRGGQLIVTRGDQPGAPWGMNLKFKCCASTAAAPRGTPTTTTTAAPTTTTTAAPTAEAEDLCSGMACSDTAACGVFAQITSNPITCTQGGKCTCTRPPVPVHLSVTGLQHLSATGLLYVPRSRSHVMQGQSGHADTRAGSGANRKHNDSGSGAPRIGQASWRTSYAKARAEEEKANAKEKAAKEEAKEEAIRHQRRKARLLARLHRSQVRAHAQMRQAQQRREQAHQRREREQEHEARMNAFRPQLDAVLQRQIEMQHYAIVRPPIEPILPHQYERPSSEFELPHIWR
jgi:hypothetical protein